MSTTQPRGEAECIASARARCERVISRVDATEAPPAPPIRVVAAAKPAPIRARAR